MLPGQLRDLGAEMVLGNTFHLSLRPGLEVIEAHGGLHGFMRWDGRSSPIPAVSRCSRSRTGAR